MTDRERAYQEIAAEPWVIAYNGYAFLYSASKLPKIAQIRKDANDAPYIVVDLAFRFTKAKYVDVFGADDLTTAYALLDLVAARHASEFSKATSKPVTQTRRCEHVNALLRYRQRRWNSLFD